MKNKRERIDQYVHDLCKSSGLAGDDLLKVVIVWKKFSATIVPVMQKLTYPELQILAANFINFVVTFETVFMRAYRNNGSGSVAAEIISMYSSSLITPTKSKK